MYAIRALRGLTLAVFLSSSCNRNVSDISGKYTGEGTGTYRPKEGAAKPFTIPRDDVVVKVTSQHYQASHVEVTIRDCVLEGDGETAWTISTRGGGCHLTFEVPSVGPVTAKMSGGLTHTNPAEVSLVLLGTTTSGESVSYQVNAKR